MDSFLEFLKGPFFRFSFAIMILGLLRIFILTLINGFEAKSKAKDKQLPMNYVKKLTIGYVLPIRAFRTKPVYSFVSIMFHVGLLITPIFLFDHALLFSNSISFSWVGITLSKGWADNLTLLTIFAGIILLIMRVSDRKSRFISRKQDYLWPLILLIPFITGWIAANLTLEPETYKFYMIIHILAGNIIFILIPFTKIAHCVLLPLSQWITARTWKFVPEAGERVEKILGKEGRKL
jgi:nitrate reductase gamma subunit